jgi:hypothetical protein
MKQPSAVVAGCALALCMMTQTGRASEFKVIGPGGGGAMFHATVNPHDAREVLVACDMTGAYISHDAARSWRMFNLRGTVQFFAFDPLRAHVIYAGTRALWRSTDDGESWNLIWPSPSTVHGIEMNSDHADETILSDPNPLGDIVALAIDPGNGHMLTAAAVKNGAAGLYVSKDDGADWEKARPLDEAPRKSGLTRTRMRETAISTWPANGASWFVLTVRGKAILLLPGLRSPMFPRAFLLRTRCVFTPPQPREHLCPTMVASGGLPPRFRGAAHK